MRYREAARPGGHVVPPRSRRGRYYAHRPCCPDEAGLLAKAIHVLHDCARQDAAWS